MAWDDCYTDRDYAHFCGYDLPDEPKEPEEFDPDDPITRSNHPPCDYCDIGCEEAPCTCMDWVN